MKKLIPILAMVLLLVCSCDAMMDEVVQTVSNPGSVSSRTVDDVTSITISFPASGSEEHVSGNVLYRTVDSGRYDTLLQVFSDYPLEEGKQYTCFISDLQVLSVKKVGDTFRILILGDDAFRLKADTTRTPFDGECRMTIRYGGSSGIPHMWEYINR